MRRAVHVCSFDAVNLPRSSRRMTYADFKAAVLKAGRFSVFEATATQRIAGFYDALCKDTSVTTTPIGFPWTKVEAAEARAEQDGERR